MSSTENRIPLQNLISLDGKVAVVTGGAAGIGYAIACRLAEAGAYTFIVDTDGEGAEKASREMVGYGYKSSSVQCDVSREEEVRDMVKSVVGEAGNIDVLVNNAGIYPRVPLDQITADDFRRVIAVNLEGTFLWYGGDHFFEKPFIDLDCLRSIVAAYLN